MSFVTHLECARCRHTLPHQQLVNLCPTCQSPLLVRYNIEEIRKALVPDDLKNRPPDMWRYLEVLPADNRQEAVSLGEGMTPLLLLPALAAQSHRPNLYLKDESLNPTGSFKARGLSAAVTMARKLGARKLAIPSAGNAGGALAAYGTRAGLETFIFIPRDTPDANILEAELTATEVTLVSGVITDAAALMSRRKDEGWFDVSTLKEPYRIEGKKTMGYEIAEQLGWKLPDVILYPAGGGTGLIGMWKAFEEMGELGWIGPHRPRMVAVQSAGCAPIVKAFQERQPSAAPWPSPHTFATGIRVPRAIGDFLMLEAIYRSQGTAVAVSEEEIDQAIEEVGRREGIFLCPEGAACWAAFRQLLNQNWIAAEESVVLFNTGAGVKYVDLIRKRQSLRST